MAMAAQAWPMPRLPSFQITMKAPNASTMPITANTSAPAKVASAGSISRMPERTIRIDSTVAASAKNAQRRAQMASRDVGSSANLRRAMLLSAGARPHGPIGRRRQRLERAQHGGGLTRDG